MKDGAVPVWRVGRWLLLAAVLGTVPVAWPTRARGAPARTRRSAPNAGYVYPAGGRVGTTLEITVGGKSLRNTNAILVSGGGVHATILWWAPPPRPLDREQSRELRRRLLEIRDQKHPTTPGEGRGGAASRRRPPPREARDPAAGKKEPVELPEHPMLEDLESKRLDELWDVAQYFLRRRNPLQRKRAIEELVRIEISIDAEAAPGVRDLRLVTRNGLTNPVCFRVGLLPEVREQEPNHPDVPEAAVVDLPVVLNGQILPRDIDRFRIRAHKGQRLVFRAEARGLVPYQADSVPGWMQATLGLYDASGQEVAFADEYRFDPDPVLFYEVVQDGEYLLEVRDAISRGREDFVYRVTVGELPFITRMFPLGGREGELTNAEIEGWNLHWRRVPLDTRQRVGGICETAWRHGDGITNTVQYAVDTLPEEVEAEPNDDPEHALLLDVPRIVNGRIGEAGDVDVFRFVGRGGDEIVAEVCARSLGSPLDSLLRLSDAKGHVIAWNDDDVCEGLGVRGLGLLTHHADSYLRVRLPRSGTYFVRLADVRGHGSEAHSYRLRVGPPRPDVTLYVTPSSISVPAGRAMLITLYAVRKDGFDGDIDITLDGAPEGFALGGARIPKGRNRVRMTLTAPRQGDGQPIPLRLSGHLRIDGEDVVRPVVPADNVMQAFLWRHILPARELAAAVFGSGRWVPIVALAEDQPVRLPRGGKATVRFEVSGRVRLENIFFEPIDPPKGVRLGAAKRRHNGFTLEIHADRDAERTGHVDNLIVEVFIERTVRNRKDETAKPEKRQFSVGFLPAIPVVVQRGRP